MSDQMQYCTLWEQNYYQQPADPGLFYQEFPEVSSDYYSQLSVQDEKSLPENTRNMHPVSSPETASPGKPKRRRSKASPSQTTTFLNASIKNFRAVVQQHTGCHNAAASGPKGPITLCFGSNASSAQFNNQYYS